MNYRAHGRSVVIARRVTAVLTESSLKPATEFHSFSRISNDSNWIPNQVLDSTRRGSRVIAILSFQFLSSWIRINSHNWRSRRTRRIKWWPWWAVVATSENRLNSTGRSSSSPRSSSRPSVVARSSRFKSKLIGRVHLRPAMRARSKGHRLMQMMPTGELTWTSTL